MVFHDNNDPYFGTGCRCVKIEYDANGNEEGPASKTNAMSKEPRLSKVNPELKIKNNKISLYPSPFSNILYIRATVDKEYSFQIFNALGQLVKSGQFVNNQADLSSLSAGVYLIRINNSEATVKVSDLKKIKS